ncbi:MAG: tripartite tricarboxylate transporter TctB family protein [bacterium]
MKVNRWGEIVLLCCIVVFACMFLLSLKDVPFQAQLFPLVVLAFMLPLSLVRLLMVASGRSATAGGPASAPGEAPLGRTDASMAPAAVWAWAVGTAGAMLALGFVWGTGLSVLVYLRVYSRAKWPASLGVAAAVALFVFVVFSKIMLIDLHPGLLRR